MPTRFGYLIDVQVADSKYDSPEHRAQRKHWRPIVAAGQAWCVEPICLEEGDGRSRWIEPGTPWHVAHYEDGVNYRGPAHARCNDSEGSRRWHDVLKHGDQPPRRWEL